MILKLKGKGLCEDKIPLYKLIQRTFKPAVASVDFLSSTKDLPYAHFDAEAFVESNERVIYFKSQIKYDLKNRNYGDARKKSGQILHTIQDFYSHSNWVRSLLFYFAKIQPYLNISYTYS